jgi:hypothetical protein
MSETQNPTILPSNGTTEANVATNHKIILNQKKISNNHNHLNNQAIVLFSLWALIYICGIDTVQ